MPHATARRVPFFNTWRNIALGPPTITPLFYRTNELLTVNSIASMCTLCMYVCEKEYWSHLNVITPGENDDGAARRGSARLGDD